MLSEMPAPDAEDLRVLGELDAMRSELGAQLRAEPRRAGRRRPDGPWRVTGAGLLTPQANATTRVYLLSGAATEIAEAGVRGPGRDPYPAA